MWAGVDAFGALAGERGVHLGVVSELKQRVIAEELALRRFARVLQKEAA